MAKRKRRPKTKTTATAPRAYSYIRFSTPEQALKDSERRQVENAQAWAAENGHEFDQTLAMTDRGLSGFHGDHRKKGALGRFLSSVESGEVPAGSTLVVENVDRLSREGAIKALQGIIFKLWDKGIVLQTLTPLESYGPGCDTDAKFLALMIYLSRAQDESLRKSERVRAARNEARRAARKTGKILTRRCPEWLRVIDDKFEVIPEARDALKMIFEMKLEGIGIGSITKKLNDSAPWTPPRKAKRKTAGWRDSYVKKILTNRAVIGEYQPHERIAGKRQPSGDPIDGYYPAVIESEKFAAVQGQFKENAHRPGHAGGRIGKVRNLFTHMVTCGYCGGPMAFVNKGKQPKGANYLICYNASRGLGCQHIAGRYDEFEETVLRNCRKLNLDVVLPEPDAQAEHCRALRHLLSGLEEELATTKRQISEYVDRVSDPSKRDLADLYEEKIRDLRRAEAEYKSRHTEADIALRKAEQGQQSFDAWNCKLEALLEVMKNGDIETRQRLRAHLRSFIDTIDVFTQGRRELPDREKEAADSEATLKAARAKRKANKTGDGRARAPFPPPESEYAQHVDDNVEHIEDYLDAVISEIGGRDVAGVPEGFIDYVLQRRMSREGRFYRVRFKTGSKLDLVPPGSLADGRRLTSDEDGEKQWRFVRPDIGGLLADYKKKLAGKKRKREATT